MMHFRKFAPIDRDNPIFELVEGEDVLLDVSVNDDGKLEVAFHLGIAGRVIDYDALLALLETGRRMALNEPG